MKNIILLFFILAFTSCQNYYRTKEAERNEILRIFRGFKSVKSISVKLYKKEYRYSFTSKPFVYNKDDYNANEFDSLLLKIEGIENASSKLYLDDFVCLIVYDKEKDAFVHASAVKQAGMRYLNEGDKLEFNLEDGPKGPSAVNLKKID